MRRLTPPSESDSARIPKACLPCAQVKARCETEAGDDTCRRCRRLRKTCSGQIPGAHRRKKAKTSEVARLEQKLDSVAAVLAASQQVPTGVGAVPLSASSPAELGPGTWIDQFVKSTSEAEMILQTYRNEMEPLFPFVVTKPNAAFIDLRHKKPFLALAILMVGCRHDPVRQIAIAKKIREVVSYNVLIKTEQSLDMLQSLLVYVNWYHLHLHLGSQLCNLVHLIMAIVIELGLNKEAFPKNIRLSFGPSGYFSKAESVPLAMPATDRAAISSSTIRTLEERRTFLGCFFLTSMVSMFKRDMEPIRYSRYVNECCRIISEAVKYPTDVYVVHLARLHGLADKITCTLSHDDCHMIPALTSAPISACVKMLESELLQIKSLFPEEAHQNSILLMHFYMVEIFLYETALNDNIEPLRYGTNPFARLNMLYACLNSTKLFFDTVNSFPVSEFFSLPYTIWTYLGHTLSVLSRLSLLRVEGWDQNYVRSVLDISECLDNLASRLDEAKAAVETLSGQISHNSLARDVPQPFLMLSSNLQRVKAAHEAKYTAQTTNESDQSPDLSCAELIVMSTDDELVVPPTTSFFEFLDENFWQQFT